MPSVTVPTGLRLAGAIEAPAPPSPTSSCQARHRRFGRLLPDGHSPLSRGAALPRDVPRHSRRRGSSRWTVGYPWTRLEPWTSRFSRGEEVVDGDRVGWKRHPGHHLPSRFTYLNREFTTDLSPGAEGWWGAAPGGPAARRTFREPWSPPHPPRGRRAGIRPLPAPPPCSPR